MAIDLEATRAELGIATQRGFAAILGTSLPSYKRMVSTGAVIAPIERLARAYIAGYRPDDWSQHTTDRRAGNSRRKKNAEAAI